MKPRRVSGPAGRAPRPPSEPRPAASALDQPPRLRNHFFAFLPPPGLRTDLAELGQTLRVHTGGRLEPIHRLHLTVCFIGPLAPEHEGVLRAAGEAACAVSGPIEVSLDHFGRFARSDVVWIGPSEPPAPGLVALNAALRHGCAGLPLRRPLTGVSPHVSLLRHAEPRVEPPEERLPPRRWTADRLHLLRTDPSEGGRVYTVLATWSLRSDRA